jgi:hypothetical protein
VHKEVAVILKRLDSRARRRKSEKAESGKAQAKPVAKELMEASTSFDGELVRPFLERVGELVSEGFDAEQREELAVLIDSLDVDRKHEEDFTVRYDGQQMPLRVRVLMDDSDAPSLFFFAPQKLAQRIQEEMGKFFEERGM